MIIYNTMTDDELLSYDSQLQACKLKIEAKLLQIRAEQFIRQSQKIKSEIHNG